MDRENQIERLGREELDILVIGGGATGTGIALDAVSRGLKTALVEREDFGSGTSSRSTKLVHGGVRYLEQAVKKLDRSQLKLVRDALHERTVLLKIAPHLVRPLAILTPLYNRLEVPYFRTGLSLYDKLAGKKSLFPPSYFVKSQEALERFPMLIAEGLRGAVIYHDGQFDDARMNVCLALTAVEHGAIAVNYVEVTELKHHDGKVVGARVRDGLSGREVDISAKVVINAAGPFADAIRRMDDPNAAKMLNASSGVHIVLDRAFSPPDTGLLVPRTEDGRVLFLLPWLGHTLVGTTDNPATIVRDPCPTEDEVEYILRQLKKYFAITVSRDRILAAWSGLRPLVADPRAADTARLSRDHVVNVSAGGLVTIAGGKWTTYRKMALDAVDHAIQVAGIQAPASSGTETIPVAGGKDWRPGGEVELEKKFGLPADIALHLHRAYGDRAPNVLKNNALHRLAKGHPYIEAEIHYGIRQESARKPIDVLARRTRLLFLDRQAAKSALPRTIEILAKDLGWDSARCENERQDALRQMERSYFL